MWKRVFKGNKQDEVNATKAHEGVQNSMYFDKEKGRWRERGKEHLEQEEVAPAPPPTMGSTKSVESEPSGDGPAADNDAQKEAFLLDALTAPPNLYANMLSRGKTPAQKPQRPMGFGNFPTMQPATTVPERQEGDEGKENDGAETSGGGPPSAPFVSTADSGPPSNPFAPKMAAVPSNPFAPKSSGGTTGATSNPFAPKNPGGAGANMNPNAPRAFGGGATTSMNPLPPRGRLPREEREKARKPQAREKTKSNPIYANIPAYNPGFTMADTIPRPDAEDMLPESEGGEDNSLANELAADRSPQPFSDSAQLPPPPPVPEPVSSHEDALDSLSPVQPLHPHHSSEELAPAAASPPVPPVPAIPQLRVRNSPFGGGRRAATEPSIIPEAAPLEDQPCDFDDEGGEIAVGAQAGESEDEAQTTEQTGANVGDGFASDTQDAPAVADAAASEFAAMDTSLAPEFEDGELIEGKTECENAAILKIQSSIRGYRGRSLSSNLRSAKQARMASELAAPEVTNSMTDSWGDLGGILADAPPATTVATEVEGAEAIAPEPTPAADATTTAPATVPGPAEATGSGWDDDFDFDDADFAAPMETAQESAAETTRSVPPKEDVADGSSIAPVEPAVVAEEEVNTTGDVQADPCMSANGESISSWVVLSDEQRGTSGEGTSGETTVADSPLQAASPSVEAGSPTLAAGQVDAEINKHQAAMRLQAKHRGNVGRSEMRRIKSDREERRASELQAEAIAAALAAEKAAEATAREDIAVTKIQSIVRGNRGRVRSNSLRTATQVEASVQMQEAESKHVEVAPAVSVSEISHPEIATLLADIEKLRQDNADLQQRLKEADGKKVQDLLIRNTELETKLHEADVIHQTAREQLDEAHRQVAEAERRADAAVDAAAKASAAASAAPTKAEKFASPGSDEFNLPDFVWSCGNSEVMAFVQKLVAEVNDLKKQQHSATTSQQGTADAFPVDSAIAFVNKIEEGDAHQIQPLLKVLADHADNAQVCSQALTALENLTFTVVENRQTIVQHGGIETILSVMERHNDLGTAIQRPAMDALWNLTFCEDAVDRVNFSNGIERIVDAMRRDPDISELQGSACAVILNLAVREDVRRRVVDCGALDLISAAMQRHAENEEVLEQGCQALYMLAYHQELRPHVIAARGDDMATLAASCKNDAGRAQMWGRWLQEVLLA